MHSMRDKVLYSRSNGPMFPYSEDQWTRGLQVCSTGQSKPPSSSSINLSNCALLENCPCPVCPFSDPLPAFGSSTGQLLRTEMSLKPMWKTQEKERAHAFATNENADSTNQALLLHWRTLCSQGWTTGENPKLSCILLCFH